jgi:hypothetical protein
MVPPRARGIQGLIEKKGAAVEENHWRFIITAVPYIWEVYNQNQAFWDKP